MEEREKSLLFEAMNRIDEEEKTARLEAGKWGAWFLTGDRKFLGIERRRRGLFAVEIEDIKSLGPLYWFAIVKGSDWLQRGDVEDLIKVFDDLFGCEWICEGLEKAGMNTPPKFLIGDDQK